MKKIILTALLVPAMALAQTYPSPTFNSVTLQNPLTPANGGTGVANSSTITLGGNLTISGANPLTFTTTGSTNVTLPTSGTLLNSTSGATAGSNSNITSLSGLTTPLSVSQGGTGSSTATGSGSVVLSTSPTIASPTIGSPSISGLVAAYNGISTVANGIPSEYAQVNSTAQSASISTTTLYAVPPSGSGFYLVIADLICTTSGTAGSVSASASWNNGSAGVTATTGPMSLTSLGNETTQMFIVYSAASQNITYSTAVTGAAGSPRYSIRIRLIYLG